MKRFKSFVITVSDDLVTAVITVGFWAMMLLVVFAVTSTCRGADTPFAKDLDPTLPTAIAASVFFDPTSSRWVGSGTAIASNGEKTLILTCEHVLSRGNGITVVWYDGRRSSGEVFYRDEDLDAAIAIVDGPALAVAPISTVSSKSQIWAVGFPGRSGPTTRRVEFEGVVRKSGEWLFVVKGGSFGKGASGSGVFQDGRLVSMTTGGEKSRRFNTTATGPGRNDLLEFVKNSAKSAPRDCPFNLLDPLGLFSGRRNRDRERGESKLDLNPNVRVQLPLPRPIPGLRQAPSEPPSERTDGQASRLDRLEDSFRDFKTVLLRDVAALVAQELSKGRVPLTLVPESRAVDMESRVEVIMEARERLDRDTAKLLTELRRRSEQFDRLANQLDKGAVVK